MNVSIKNIPHDKNEWDVTRAIATLLHSEDFNPESNQDHDERKLNFKVELNINEKMGVRNDGTGTLTLPGPWGHKFLRYVKENPLKLEKTKLRFHQGSRAPRHLAMTLEKTPYTSPDLEEERQSKNRLLDEALRVDAVQFGVFFRPRYYDPPRPREYSIEWERDFSRQSTAWLRFEYDHKLIRITLGDCITELEGYTIAISLASINKIGIGNDPKPYLCFDTITPPVLEKIEFHRPTTGNKSDNNKSKHRIGSLQDGHERVSAFTPKLRVVLYHDQNRDMGARFREMCEIAGLSAGVLLRCDGRHHIEASRQNFFAENTLYKLRKQFHSFDWHVAFQLELLLHNGLLTTTELNSILPDIKRLCQQYPDNNSLFAGKLLRKYSEALPDRPPTESPQACFRRIAGLKVQFGDMHLAAGHFECCHVTFTPTRLILEGPYATQSNRVIRRYRGYEEHFIRVDFRDEDRLNFRWDREVDGSSFLKERVGRTLKQGFLLAGRAFEFLAYSNSALREHSVWFMRPFHHPTGLVTAEFIRQSLGNFKGTDLLKCPSKYAARLAQAFTATDPSVSIRRDEWELVEDLNSEPIKRAGKEEPDVSVFTDGVGTISEGLALKIWNALCEQRPRSGANYIQPSAYQIRFLGFKGVVAVDKELDKHPGGIQMRLRRSMKKFESTNEDEAKATIEIARAFEKPNISYLNRALVMVLEDREVKRDSFIDLQNEAVAEARTIDDSLSRFHTTLRTHGYGNHFQLPSLLQRLENRGCVLKPDPRKFSVEAPFLKQIREVAMMDILREIKHGARVKIPGSYLLVGVADEGVAYKAAGYDNVYTLEMSHIYACIQMPDDPEPTWLEGSCMISRSPVCHPGDVQRVYAIGKPPADKLCLFAHLKNVVVLPCVGQRSLASCLGGGDLDGDLYDVIMCPELLTPNNEIPAAYPAGDIWTLEEDCTVDNICDFVVEYINSDVLGLLSDRLLIIADQSIVMEGIKDGACLKLAELCSKAVDYPKQGIPVNLEENPLPPTLMRPKPDWHAAEVVDPRKTDYYSSDKALGLMYRAITLTEPRGDESGQSGWSKSVNDFLKNQVVRFIDGKLDDSAISGAFFKYSDELRYISLTHTLSNAPGVRLLESEIVAGTIMAKCSQKRWRKDRIYRMRLHASTLFHTVRREFLDLTDDRQAYVTALGRAWLAWNYANENYQKFGANSFALIALGVILECLEILDPPTKSDRVEYDNDEEREDTEWEMEYDI